MDTNPFYTLTDSRNYTLHRLFSKRGLDPQQALQSIVEVCAEQGRTSVKFRFPSAEAKQEMADRFASSSSTAKRTPSQSYLAGLNACMRIVEAAISRGAISIAEAEHKVTHPIDMTLREMAFAAKTLEVEFWFLMREIAGETSPDSDIMQRVKNWKRDYLIEQARHEETRRIAAQRKDEVAGCRRIIAQLRETLHREGLQDPTLQAVRPQGETSVGEADQADAGAAHSQEPASGRSGQGAHGDGALYGHHHNGGTDNV
jgi:hypothetical protein